MNIQTLPLESIEIRDEWNCRDLFFAHSLRDLGDSLLKYKQLMPVLVARHEDRYQLVAGFRRCHAAKMVGLETIEAVVSDLDADTLRRVNVIENIERRELSMLEEARSLRMLYGESIDVVRASQELQRSRNWILRRIGLLECDEKIQQAAASGRLTEGGLKRILEAPASERLRILSKLLVERDRDTSGARRISTLRDATVKLVEAGLFGTHLDALAFAEGLIDFDTLVKRISANTGTK